MAKKMQEEKKEEHHHKWVMQPDYGSYRCVCGGFALSEKEHDRRVEEYDNYYQIVRQTDTYQDFLAMREAYNTRNRKQMSEISVRVKERLKADDYLPKPSFLDPRDLKVEVI